MNYENYKKVQELGSMVAALTCVYEINQDPRFDAFFDYSGHVHAIKVRVYKIDSDDLIFDKYLYIDGDLKCSDEEIKKLIKDLTNIVL